jgi:tetratricopeptide (TPR) repeat protein
MKTCIGRCQVAIAGLPLFRAAFRRLATRRPPDPEDTLSNRDEVLRSLGDAIELALRKKVATALVERGSALSDLNRYEEALDAFDEVIRRFGAATEPALREQVTRASYKRGSALFFLKRYADALAAFDEVIRRFGAAPEPVEGRLKHWTATSGSGRCIGWAIDPSCG